MRAWLFLLGLTTIAAASIAQAEECNKASDMASMNECLAKSYKRADDELNLLYQQLIGRVKQAGADWADTHTALVAAQRAWIAFREAECALVGSKTDGSFNTTVTTSSLTG
ncbi:lysozyme inhibitor LprI family protein [Methylocystis sp.]|uniref:lysozyme inhibitor LprI family protein n=1 Tax=Methylocystis sp. TaxID=1911079 RepID=UPI0025F24F61|nr:lysozyme inhibitor LprI family protein [Methylocystis sp.]